MEADSYEKKADQKEEYTIDTQKKYASIQLDPAVVQVGESKKMPGICKNGDVSQNAVFSFAGVFCMEQ